MLTKVILRDWRAHTHTEIPLSPFTLLVGPNGAGKTSVLDGLYLIGMPFQKDVDKVFFGPFDPQWLRRQNAVGPAEVAVTGRQGWTLGLRINANEPFVQLAVGGSVALRDTHLVAPVAAWGREKLWEGEGMPSEARLLRKTIKLRLDPIQLAEPSSDDGSTVTIGRDGSGLATALAEMKLNDSDRFDEILECAQGMFPLLQSISFRKTKKSRTSEDHLGQVTRETFPARELLLTFRDAKALPAHAASEGTLLVLGFLAAIFSPERPKLILLDDVDRALHPRAQQKFIRLLQRLRKQLDVQIIATTHSPFLVDCFDASEVVVLLRNETTGLIISSLLSEHPDADLLDALSTGEFWMARGEKRETKATEEANGVGE